MDATAKGAISDRRMGKFIFLGTLPPNWRSMLMGRRVLIVEDDDFVADQLAALIEGKFGCVPVVASNLRSAIDNTDVDFGFLDVVLPDGESFAIAEQLRERGVPFVFVSASDPATLPASLADAPFLRKPVALPALLAAARAHL